MLDLIFFPLHLFYDWATCTALPLLTDHFFNHKNTQETGTATLRLIFSSVRQRKKVKQPHAIPISFKTTRTSLQRNLDFSFTKTWSKKIKSSEDIQTNNPETSGDFAKLCKRKWLGVIIGSASGLVKNNAENELTILLCLGKIPYEPADFA